VVVPETQWNYVKITLRISGRHPAKALAFELIDFLRCESAHIILVLA
jgi:hypothetical protein